MKKHQLIAMALSALSAGILMSCSKSTESNSDSASVDSAKTVNSAKNGTSTASADSAASNNATNLEAIKLKPEVVQSYLTHVADNQIVPAYQEVAKQSHKLNRLSYDFCQAGSVDNEQLRALRDQWLVLAKAWAAAEIVNFGPAMDSMSHLYINYFPDQRGLVHQGVIDLIDANPQLTPEQLAAESAIVQGIPGMEEVLFANETLSKGQCQYMVSASRALTDRLDSVQAQWEGDAKDLLGINPTNPINPVNQEASNDINNSDNKNSDNKNSDIKNSDIKNLGMNRWINAILSMVETTKSRSLDQPLGLTGSKKGHLPAAAAGQSRAIISAKVAALSKALTDSSLVAILAENDRDTLADDLSTILADTSALLAQLPENIADASPSQQKDLYDKLTTLTQLIKHQLMPTLGVQVGFNSTDGD